MDTRAAAPRVLLLTAVAAGHGGALLALLALTRTYPVPLASDETWTLVMLPLPEVGHALLQAPERQRHPVSPAAPALPQANSPSQPTAVARPSAAIDWRAEAAREADREVERNEHRARQARALTPTASAALSPAPARAPESHWDYAAIHRVQAVRGGATLIHLGDHCILALFLAIPMGFGCAVGEIPARGDLFEHLHDQVDPGEPAHP